MVHEAIDYRTPLDVLMEREESGGARCEVRTGVSSHLRFEQILELADFARTYPAAWPTIKLKLRHPELCCQQIAGKLGISPRTVLRHLSKLKVLRRRAA